MRRAVTIPSCLAAWVEKHMPDLQDLKGVRFLACDRVPFEWLPGFLPNIAGITLWNTVYLKGRSFCIDCRNLDHVDLVVHELVHVTQFQKAPLLFPIRYLIDLVRFGYWNVPAEREARDAAFRLVAQYRAQKPCGPLPPQAE